MIINLVLKSRLIKQRRNKASVFQYRCLSKIYWACVLFASNNTSFDGMIKVIKIFKRVCKLEIIGGKHHHPNWNCSGIRLQSQMILESMYICMYVLVHARTMNLSKYTAFVKLCMDSNTNLKYAYACLFINKLDTHLFNTYQFHILK